MKFLALSVFTLLLSLGSTFAAVTVTCSSLELNPVRYNGERILSQFLDTEDADCWNRSVGTNNVVYPHSWGQFPNASRKKSIKLALDALFDSRSALTLYGNLRNPIYIVLSDSSGHVAEAYWPIEGSYWIEMEADTRLAPDNRFKYAIAHEVGHCLIMERDKLNYTPMTTSLRSDWWDESGAEWLASIVYQDYNFEFLNSRIFDLDGHDFRNPYSSYVLFHSFAQSHTVEATLDLLKQIFRNNSNDNQLFHFFRTNSIDKELHTMLIKLMTGSLMDQSGVPVDRETVVLNHSSHNTTPDGSSFTVPPLESARLRKIEVIIPEGYNLSLFPNTEAASLNQSIIIDGILNANWAEKAVARGSCSSEFSTTILLSHMNNNNLEGVDFQYSLTEIEGCDDDSDEDENEEEQGCLEGDWVLDHRSLRRYWERSAPPQSEFTGSTGEMTVTFNTNRTLVFKSRNLRFTTETNLAGPSFVMKTTSKVNGNLNLSYNHKSSSKLGLLDISASGMTEIIIDMMGTVTTSQNPWNIGNAKSINYSCVGDTFTFHNATFGDMTTIGTPMELVFRKR